MKDQKNTEEYKNNVDSMKSTINLCKKCSPMFSNLFLKSSRKDKNEKKSNLINNESQMWDMNENQKQSHSWDLMQFNI